MTSFAMADVTDLPDGTGKAFTINGKRLALFHLGGAWYAIDDRCSHANASLSEGELDRDEGCVLCPLHGSPFDLATGHPRSLPAYAPVSTYRVWVEDKKVMIELP